MADKHPYSDAPEKIKRLMSEIMKLEKARSTGGVVVVNDITLLIKRAVS